MHFGWHLHSQKAPHRAATARAVLARRGQEPMASEEADRPANLAAAREITFSRRIRTQLDALVRSFERAAGEEVGEDFRVIAEGEKRIVLQSGRRTIAVRIGSRAHRLALETLSRFHDGPDHPSATLRKDQRRSLSVSHAGIVYTQGI